jgi:hypothetical protein
MDDFSVTTAQPTTQASSIVFSSISTSSITATWTNGNGGRRAVFMKDGSGSITNPSDGTAYSASSNWNSKGTQLGSSGYYCIYDGTGNSVSLTNLAAGTTYYFQVFEYNSNNNLTPTAAAINYLTTTASNNPNNQATTSPTPAISLADNGNQVSASSVAAGSTHNILHQSSLAVTTANATLTGISFTTAGTYADADVSNFKVWYSADNSFATTGDNTQLGSTITTNLEAGAKSVSSLSQAINSGSTGYIFITTDIAALPTGGNTINVSALTTSDISFSSGKDEVIPAKNNKPNHATPATTDISPPHCSNK